MEFPTFFQEADKRFPWLVQTEAILPVGMVLDLSRLPNDAIHVSGFGEEGGNVV
jgi:hypothetical protein